jgi:hypothetical protein
VGIRGHRPAVFARPVFTLLAAVFALCLGLVLAAGPSGAAPLDDWTLRAELAPVCVMDLDTDLGAGTCAASPAGLAAAPAAVPDMLSAVLPGFDALLPQAIGSATARFSESVAPIPLPAAGWMLLAGLGALGLWGKRRDGRVVPLRATLRTSARTDLGLRPGPVRLPGFAPFSDLLLDRSAGGRIPHAFAPGRSSPVRPVGGAGHRYAATAERAPPTAAADVTTPVVADPSGSGVYLPRLLGPKGPAARFFAHVRPEDSGTPANQNGPTRPASAADGQNGQKHHARGSAPVPDDRAAKEQSLIQFIFSGVPSMSITKKLGGLTAAALVAAFGLAAPASAVTLVGQFSGNDPAPFDLVLPAFGINTPALAKCDVPAGALGCDWENGGVPNEDYTSAFNVTFTTDKDGTWEFLGGAGLSLVPHYMAVKAGPNWLLFDLEGALSGSWSTFGLLVGGGPSGGNQPGLSHLSFYNTGKPDTPIIPLPAAAWLMLAGIGGLGAVARRRKSA